MMGYWRSEWGQAEKDAYKAGIRKGRKLEYEERMELEEIPFMCTDNNGNHTSRKSKIDQVIEALHLLGTKIDHNTSVLVDIAQRQEKAAARNTKPLTITIPPDIQVDAAVKRAIRELVK